MSLPVTFLLAVNDHRNGCSLDRISGAELQVGGECGLELSGGIYPASSCPRFIYYPPVEVGAVGSIRISRRKFTVLSYRTWVGNWCWDQVRVGPAVAASILNYLRGLDWQNEGGRGDIGDHWDSGRKFRPSDISVLATTAEELAERKRRRGRLAGAVEVNR